VSTPAQLDELETGTPAPDAGDVDEPTGDEAELAGGDVDEAAAAAAPEPELELEVDQAVGDEQARQQALAQRDEQAQVDAVRDRKLASLEGYIGRKLEEIFGKEAADSLELCELCTWTHTHGWRVDALPPPAVVEAVKRAIGIGSLDQYNEFPAFQTCQACGGQCSVKTGAKAGNELTRKCPICKGRGYSSSLPEDANRAAAVDPVAAEPQAEGLPAAMPDRDMFGTPAGHPDYGKMPQFREIPVSHWQEHAPTP
jgi:hypothetical protein